MGMEHRVIMAMERVVVLQGLVVVLLENQELGDIDTALLHQGKEITDDGSSFQFEAIERLGSGREKDYSLHLSVSSVSARQQAALEHWIG
ncbi:LysR family transcriptional regulator [Mesorhizobium loti]|nr:LysR family transcriptional regulator [Mesorhizobium loti]